MLRIEDVDRSFGGLAAVSVCNITVEAGTITGPIGPNGAGKTTFFNIIAGAFPPSAGKILFEGKDVTGLGIEGRRVLVQHRRVAENNFDAVS